MFVQYSNLVSIGRASAGKSKVLGGTCKFYTLDFV